MVPLAHIWKSLLPVRKKQINTATIFLMATWLRGVLRVFGTFLNSLFCDELILLYHNSSVPRSWQNFYLLKWQISHKIYFVAVLNVNRFIKCFYPASSTGQYPIFEGNEEMHNKTNKNLHKQMDLANCVIIQYKGESLFLIAMLITLYWEASGCIYIQHQRNFGYKFIQSFLQSIFSTGSNDLLQQFIPG